MRFDDRREAGSLLGEELRVLAPSNPIVLALPRGGVPVGFEVARILECPLDVLLVRKIGVPGQPELAMGAVAEGGVVVRNQALLDMARVTEEDFQEGLALEIADLEDKVRRYRAEVPAIDPRDHTALIVDDGLATGATALAGVRAIRAKGASQVWVCVPVAPADTTAALASEADRVVVLSVPSGFGAVGIWYRDFGQVDDREVRDLLSESRLR
jgi:putative phosphoribosyl transferase